MIASYKFHSNRFAKPSLFLMIFLGVLAGFWIYQHKNAGATVTGTTTLYFHKERSDYNQTYNSLALTTAEPSTDTVTSTAGTTTTTNPPTALCNSSGNTADTFNVVTVSATTTGYKCFGSFISQPMGQARSISTTDGTTIVPECMYFNVGNTKVTANPVIFLYALNTSTGSLSLFKTITGSSTSSTTAANAVAGASASAPDANVSLAAGDRIVAIATANITVSNSGGQGNTASFYFDNTKCQSSFYRGGAAVAIGYAFTSPNMPTLTGSMDEDFSTSYFNGGGGTINICGGSGSTAYHSRWNCQVPSASNAWALYNVGSNPGGSTNWLQLTNSWNSTPNTPSDFGTTPSNAFFYQSLPGSYGNGTVRTSVSTSAAYVVGTTTPSPTSRSGLVLWSSNTDYLEAYVGATASTTGANSVSVSVVTNSSSLGSTILNTTTTSGAYNHIWLGFTNTGGSYQAQYSTDGSTWINFGTALSHSPFLRVGLNSFNGVAATSVGYESAFNWFQYTFATTTFSQISYRWFANTDSVTPTSPFVAQNTPYTLTSAGQQFRLRSLVSATGQVGVGGKTFDLQYAPLGANASCSTVPSASYSSTTYGNSWTSQSSIPHNNGGESSSSFTNFNGKLWSMGGVSGSFGSMVEYSDVWSSSDGVNWSLVTAAANWPGRFAAKAIEFNNKLWILGGENGTSGTPLNDVWSSSDGITWTQATAAAGWSARAGMAVVVFNNKLWVIGGATGGSNDVWSSSDGITWTQATAAAGWSARANIGAAAFNNKLWVFGGSSGSTYLNDVWSSSDGITWTQVTTAPWRARDVAGATVYGGRIWMLGGSYNNGSVQGLPDVWFTDNGTNWYQVSSSVPLGQPAVLNGIWISNGANAYNSTNPVISSYDNPTPLNNANIVTTGSDPTDLSQTIVPENYWEGGFFSNNQSLFGSSSDAEWDFSLVDNGAPAGTSYCFRIVGSDGSLLSSYSNYPMITSYTPGPTTDQVMRGGTWFNSSGVKQDKYWAH